MELVVMFPCRRSIGRVEEFIMNIRKSVPDAFIVPVLNGHPIEKLVESAAIIESEKCHAVLVEGQRGLLNALVAGYTYVLKEHSGATVVKMDTAEHPTEGITRLAQKANEVGGMVVGDLRFGEGMLREGSVDEFANMNLFPELFRQVTTGRVSLSGSYGFLAFDSGSLKTILLSAKKIVGLVETKQGSISWGLDGAMLLAAMGVKVPLEICYFEAEMLRDRKSPKVAAQFAQTLSVCLAALQVFPKLTEL